MDEPHVLSRELSVEQYADAVASGAPTPGGGSAAAVTGALAAGLCEMVCRLTLAGMSAASDPEPIQLLADRAGALRTELLDLATADEEAFGVYRAAAVLPRGTDAELEHRRRALQSALERAAAVPLDTARHCLEILELLAEAAQTSTKHALSDVSAGALLAQAAADGALMSVEANAKMMRSSELAEALLAETERVHLSAGRFLRSVQANVQGRQHR